MEYLDAAIQTVQSTISTSRGLASASLSACGLALTVAASFVRTMVKLRALAVGSSVLLLTSALVSLNIGAILLFCILVPLNMWRLVEIRQLSRKISAASAHGDLSGIWLKPYMKAHRMRSGEVLFRKGDAADNLYLLVEGELELVEIGRMQPRGDLFGEISFFSPDRVRTLSAVCHSDCLLLSMNEPSFKQLYFQNPKFAFQVANLLARRLGADVQRLRQRVEELEASRAPAT